MKILLVGEYSNLHNNLKDGLLELGHECVILSGSDGFKQLDSDIKLITHMHSIKDYLKAYLGTFRILHQIQNDYDVIQLINPIIVPLRMGLNRRFINKLLTKANKGFLLLAGDDTVFWDFMKKKGKDSLRYSYLDDVYKYELKGKKSFCDVQYNKDWNLELAEKVDGIIPIMYEYAEAYRQRRIDLLKTLPIPINTEKNKYHDNIIKSGKLVVFHGLNRYYSKGTRFVEQAFELLKKKYPNDLELIIDGKMNYTEYVQLLSKVNVVIDQTNSYSLAVNALTSMAKGKIVLGGAEPESFKELGYEFCPAINIIPDANQIVKQLEILLENRKSIPEIGYQSRLFIEKYHDYKKVAQLYVNHWQG